MNMNRQIRRAQEKSDKKKEKEQEKQRAARRAKRQRRPAASKPAEKSTATNQHQKNATASQPTATGFRRSGRFTGFLALLTTVFIVLRAFAPDAGADTTTTVIASFFYLFWGYFACLWLLRRGSDQAFPVTLSSGIVLATIVELVKYLNADATPQPVMVFLAAPGLVIGAFIARFVHRKTQG